MKNNFLTIKEFSLLTHTPIDTLKHYDRINLLKPAYTGENNYRYYLPEQAVLLTRILFDVKAKVHLSEIKDIIIDDDHENSYKHYQQITENISHLIDELQAIQGTLSSLKSYYEMTIKNPTDKLFVKYFPEWFIISSPKLKLSAKEGSVESNIADNLFIQGFHNGMWPHYQLGCMYTEDDIRNDDFTSPAYCLKIDFPEKFALEEITFVPGGDYYCLLLKVGGKGLSSAVKHFLAKLALENKRIQGNIFVLDVINNFFTTKQEHYCTLIYAHIRDEGE